MGGLFNGIADLFGALADIGADLPPEVRERAQKVVISAIIVTQIATQAATMAAQSAASAAAASTRRVSK